MFFFLISNQFFTIALKHRNMTIPGLHLPCNPRLRPVHLRLVPWARHISRLGSSVHENKSERGGENKAKFTKAFSQSIKKFLFSFFLKKNMVIRGIPKLNIRKKSKKGGGGKEEENRLPASAGQGPEIHLHVFEAHEVVWSTGTCFSEKPRSPLVQLGGLSSV